MLILII